MGHGSTSCLLATVLTTHFGNNAVASACYKNTCRGAAPYVRLRIAVDTFRELVGQSNAGDRATGNAIETRLIALADGLGGPAGAVAFAQVAGNTFRKLAWIAEAGAAAGHRDVPTFT